MRQVEIDMLSELYDNYTKTNNREFSIRFSSPSEKCEYYKSLDYLQECDYITYTAQAAGFCEFKLTVNGIKFAQNGYKEISTAPIIQGNNSIYVNGSDNKISDNYNQISVNISESDIPDDCKKLIETFLYEIKNPQLTKEKKTEKIKNFLSDISSGTISGVASSGLTALLASLLSKLF